MVEVNGSCQNPKVLKSITGRLADLYVTGFVINQCVRSLKRHGEFIRDPLRSETPTPVVLLDLLLTSRSFVCNDTRSAR